MAKILFVTNDAWFFVSHRLPLAVAFNATKGRSLVAAKRDPSVDSIIKSGSEFVEWDIAPRGKSIFGEIRAILLLARIVKKHKPDIAHFITIKPVLYGGTICRLMKVPCAVFAVSGLGAIIINSTLRGKILRSLIAPFYKYSVGHTNSAIIFQNPDDRKRLIAWLGNKKLNAHMIKGSGVDLNDFTSKEEPLGIPIVTMAARLLREKGVAEFVAAATQLKNEGVSANFRIAGGNVAEGNPGAFSSLELEELRANQSVEFMGHRDDVPKLFSESSIVVLPSYYPEGLPKVLIEASASCRPVVTTDTPGCRDAVIDGKTGVIIPPRDGKALASAIKKLLLDKQKRVDMGRAGREYVKSEMSIETVVSQHMSIYDQLLNNEV